MKVIKGRRIVPKWERVRGSNSLRETIATTIATPALGPSFLIDPLGKCKWMSISLNTSSFLLEEMPNS